MTVSQGWTRDLWMVFGVDIASLLGHVPGRYTGSTGNLWAGR